MGSHVGLPRTHVGPYVTLHPLRDMRIGSVVCLITARMGRHRAVLGFDLGRHGPTWADMGRHGPTCADISRYIIDIGADIDT